MKITHIVLAAASLGFSIGVFAADSSIGGVAAQGAADIGADLVRARSEIAPDQDRAGYFSYGIASVVGGVMILAAGVLMWPRKDGEVMASSKEPR